MINPWSRSIESKRICARESLARRGLSCVLAAALLLHTSPSFANITSQAIVSGETPRGTRIDSPVAIETINLADPILGITVSQTLSHIDNDGIAGWSAGDEVLVEMSGENTGQAELNSVLIGSTFTSGAGTLNFDAPIAYQSGDDGISDIMERGETWVWQARYTITQADLDAGAPFRNIVNISGRHETETGDGLANDTLAPVQSPNLSIVKSGTSNGFTTVGDLLTWNVDITNNGNITLNNLVLTDIGANSISCPTSGGDSIATLAPQATEQCVVETAATTQNVTDATAENTASVSATAANGAVLNESSTASQSQIGIDLITQKTLASGSANVNYGDEISYLITVENNSLFDATNVSLTDQLPAGITATANNGTTTLGSYDAATGLWSIAVLPSGQSATLMLSGTVDGSSIASAINNTSTKAVADQVDPTDDGNILSHSFTPVLNLIVANDDIVGEAINVSSDANDVLNVVENDRINGVAIPPNGAIVTPIAPLPAGFTLSSEGLVSIAANTPAGAYNFDYQICESINPLNCSVANASMELTGFAPNIMGQLYLDTNSNDVFDAADVPRSNYTVQLLNGAGDVVTQATTDSDGNYTLSGFQNGNYSILYLDEEGVGAGRVDNINVSENSGEVMVANLPVDPSGVIYNSITGRPVSGSIVKFINVRTGQILPAACLLPNQQSQITRENGEYRFDLVPGADNACPVARTEYRIEIDQPVRFKPAPSENIPPQTGILRADICVGDVVPGPKCGLHETNDAPPLDDPADYYLRFLIGQGDNDIVHNHIALDPIISVATSGLFVSKSSTTKNVVRGDRVEYNVDVTNNGGFEFGTLTLKDRLPQGLSYIAGSARWNDQAINVDLEDGALLFKGQGLAVAGRATLTYAARVNANVQPGEYLNAINAITQSGEAISSVSSASIVVRPEPIFDCSEVIGQVYLDVNRNGRQDEGEVGVDGARLATVRGSIITSDRFGRFSVPCAELPDSQTGTNFILKLDVESLPVGYFETTENPRVVRLTAGKLTEMNFGVAAARDVRIDLDANAFITNSAQPNADLATALEQLSVALETERSVLRLSYYSDGESDDLIAARLELIEVTLRNLMNDRDGDILLSIETQVLK